MRAILTALFLATSVISMGQVDSNVWTLKRAIQESLQNNSLVLQHKLKVDEARAKKQNTVGSLLPNIDYHYSWSRRKDSINIGRAFFDGDRYNFYTSKFNLEQPLIYGGALWSSPKVDSEKLKQAELDLKIVKRDQAINVAKIYSKILLHQEEVEIYARQIETQDKLIKQAARMARSGTEKQMTLYRFQAQAASLKPKLIEAKNNLENEVVNFLNVSNVSVSGNIGFKEKLIDLATMQVSTTETESSKFEKLKIDSERSSHEAQKAVTMAEHYPSVSFTASFGTASNTQADLFSEYSREWAYGLSIKVPLFSGLSSITQRRALAAQSAQLRIQEKQIDKDIIEQKLLTEKNLITYRELFEASKLSMQLSKKAYEEGSKALRLGTLRYSEFFDIEKEYITSELNYLKAQREHLISKLEFSKAHEIDLEAFFDR